MLMGFKPCMAIETNVIAKLPNYGKVGFGLGSGYQLVPLMHLDFCGISSLGLVSRWTCHSLGCLGFGLGSTQGKWRWPLDFESMLCFGFHVCDSFSFFYSLRGHTSHPSFTWCLQVPRDSEEQCGSISVVGLIVEPRCKVSLSNKPTLVVSRPFYVLFHHLVWGFFVGFWWAFKPV